MPPQRAKKQPVSQSTTSLDSDVVASFPAPPANTTSAAATPSAMTPERLSPSKRKLAITETQKQALMDNLQLEITDRARKLRSQYGLLAQGLRSRLEMRVNRIPTALRKTNIMDLVEKYSDQPRAEPPTSTIARPTPSLHLKPSGSTQTSPVQKRGAKRTSDEMAAPDKENAHEEQEQDLAMPKKRAKTAANQKKGPPAANSRARAVSRQDQPLQVLSPKSNNSRTYPRSPLKSAEDEKSKSPLKSSVLSTGEGPGTKGKGAANRGGKRAAATTTAAKEKKATRASIASSNGSAATDASAGTTIVKRKATTTTAAKKTTARTATTKSAAAKATAAAKKGKENAPAATTGRTTRARAR